MMLIAVSYFSGCESWRLIIGLMVFQWTLVLMKQKLSFAFLRCVAVGGSVCLVSHSVQVLRESLWLLRRGVIVRASGELCKALLEGFFR